MTKKFKETLKKEDVTVKHFCREIDIGYGSFRSLINREKVPRWVKAFLFGYKLGRNLKEIEVTDEKIIK